MLGADETSAGTIDKMDEAPRGYRGTKLKNFPVDDRSAGLLHYTKRMKDVFRMFLLLDNLVGRKKKKLHALPRLPH